MLSQASRCSIVVSLFPGVLGFVKNKNKELPNGTNHVTYVKLKVYPKIFFHRRAQCAYSSSPHGYSSIPMKHLVKNIAISKTDILKIYTSPFLEPTFPTSSIHFIIANC